ncbi:uncharacterized protein LOC121979902 [Zingiber officinale]|uniref:uncharacterized protein LOC121979902 n=1 Tax=Zingiber officinale TaxID=94328 RepID=UPI001C4DB775|nr:uncharacterized protein LOC121979902 [Zingiber officinale]
MPQKRRKEIHETVALAEECSATIQCEHPQKLKDLGSFSISCIIKDQKINKTFCNLGASVSLMPFSLCKRLGLGDQMLTTMTLQLAKHSCRYPLGILEDVLVQIRGIVVPTDFVILEMDEDSQIPIILGRPFLVTVKVIIDVKIYKLSFTVGRNKLEFNLSKVSSDFIENQKGEGANFEHLEEHFNRPPNTESNIQSPKYNKYIISARASSREETINFGTLGGGERNPLKAKALS